MKALLVEVDFMSGRRAGGISPKNKNFPCNPLWQDTEAGVEIRLVRDGDVEPYRDVDGLIVLDDEIAIDAAVAALNLGDGEDEYVIESEVLLAESMKQKKVKLDDIDAGESPRQRNKKLYDRGALGIIKTAKTQPPSARDMARAWSAKE